MDNWIYAVPAAITVSHYFLAIMERYCEIQSGEEMCDVYQWARGLAGLASYVSWVLLAFYSSWLLITKYIKVELLV